ncbi:hypothetical protein IRJ41_023023 [Triplophysa rosa]|uniref:Uncharacterized protein n=1 Tax=Triplophysa rosa TaxID=992332 RepID=A0A9W7TWK9_TRIRA|nr:hypothetical protein IRJ41_023023 [Triplophysa rosa]
MQRPDRPHMGHCWEALKELNQDIFTFSLQPPNITDAETDSCRLTAGSSWTASPVTQTQSRPSAPARRKSPAFIQTGIGEERAETKVAGSFHE